MLLSIGLTIVGIALVAATFPLVVELAVLTIAAQWPISRRKRKHYLPRDFPLTVVVPAHNEERLIGRCIESLRSYAGARTDILVVAHNCTDKTASIAEWAGARVLVLNDPGQSGKGCALRHGFAAAISGPSQAVMVIDADSVVDPGLIAAVKRRFIAGAQALQCRYEVYNPQANRRTELMALAFQGFNVVRPQGRERLGISAGILGNGFAIHRDVLTRVSYGAYSVVEDLEYHLTLVRAGVRVEYVDAAVVRGEMPASSHGARTQRARWEGGRMHMVRQWAPKLVGDILCGRMQLVEPLLDLLSVPIATEAVLLLVAVCLPIGWLRIYALSGFVVLAVHVMSAAVSGPDFWRSMRVLATVPAYIFWKLRAFPEIWRTSRENSTWVRTVRDVPADGQ